MAQFKINFKDSNCQYVEDYNAGKYGTKIKIYFCEGDGCCPKQYSGSVGAEMITADTLEELKLKLDRAVAKRDKEIAKTLKDKKVKDMYEPISSFTKWDFVDKTKQGFKVVKMFEDLDDNRLHIIAKRDNDYVIGLGYSPEDGVWNQGRYDFSTAQDAIKELKAKYNVKEFVKKVKDSATLEGVYQCKNDEVIEVRKQKLPGGEKYKITFQKGGSPVVLDEANAFKLLKQYRALKMQDGVNCKDNFAMLTPGTPKFTKSKDTKVCDASADEIIDLFHEAYVKGRTWDWLKNKLPSTFLNLKNKRWKELFPIQADRTGKLEGVYLSKPKDLAEQYEEPLKEFLDAFWDYMRQVEHIEADYDLESEEYLESYDFDTMIRRIQDTIENTDSKARSAELEEVKKNLQTTFRGLRNLAYQIPGLSTSYLDDYAKQMLKGKGDYGNLYNYLINQINDSYRNTDYKNNQRKPIIYNKEGSYIRSDSKVGPLTPEAEAYIRKIMGGTTTEDIEAKRKERYDRNHSIPTYYSWKRSSEGVIPEYGKEMDALRDLLTLLKEEVSKEKKLGIKLSPDREELEYVGQGKGQYDYRGDFVGGSRGSYVKRGKRTGNKVDFNVEGLNDLSYALTRALNSENLDVMQENLQEALEIIKTLPRSNPKVAELKAQIDALINKRREVPRTRRNLPDKKFVKDGFNKEELKEYMELRRKLGLDTEGEVKKFSEAHGNVTDQKLLEALRKEANK